MIEVFKPMTPVAQRDQRAAYRQFLIERDGAADYERRTLTRREAGMTRFLLPPSRLRDIDHALFEARYARFDRNSKTSNEMLLLLALLKVNAAEAYGVNATFESAKKRAKTQEDDVELRLLIEESFTSPSRTSGVGKPAPSRIKCTAEVPIGYCARPANQLLLTDWSLVRVQAWLHFCARGLTPAGEHRDARPVLVRLSRCPSRWAGMTYQSGCTSRAQKYPEATATRTVR